MFKAEESDMINYAFQGTFIGHCMLSGLVERREMWLWLWKGKKKTDEHISETD